VRSLLLEPAGDVTFRLAFSRDEERRAVVHCEVAASLTLRCQRCLEAMDHRVDSRLELALVTGLDEERLLPERYDPLPAGEPIIRPRDLIEDELLLDLPQIPMHDPELCATEIRDAARAQEGAGALSPFAALAELKRKR
jgi:uncharacterized protein